MYKKRMNRREFIKKWAGYAAFGMASPAMFKGANVAKKGPDMTAEDDLLQALEASDVPRSSELLRKRLRKGDDAWEIHLSLYLVVQRAQNPPFINPHLPNW